MHQARTHQKGKKREACEGVDHCFGASPRVGARMPMKYIFSLVLGLIIALLIVSIVSEGT